MRDTTAVLERRRRLSERTLKKLAKTLSTFDEIRGQEALCIYATGSFARGEASPFSDLDVFFIDEKGSCSNISMNLIYAHLIRTCRRMELPEFSGDGRFLSLHKLDEIKHHLGSPADDHKNFFTARMLLLLESKPICNQQLYSKVVRSVIDSYYRDYHDHETAFRPTFLANDVIRYWKTLCLNYEHKRNRPAKDKKEKLRGHVKNLKLKFSRMTTCYSMLVTLAAQPHNFGPKRLLEVVEDTPLERLRKTAEKVQAHQIYNRMLKEYAWFLEATGRDEQDVLEWISDEHERDAAFDRARAYGRNMFTLLNTAVKDQETLRLLVI